MPDINRLAELDGLNTAESVFVELHRYLDDARSDAFEEFRVFGHPAESDELQLITNQLFSSVWNLNDVFESISKPSDSSWFRDVVE